MINEQTLRKEARRVLKLEGITKAYFAPHIKYGKQQDIFNAFDLLYLKGDLAYFVQITTDHNKWARKHKITKLFKGRPLPPRCYIWAYIKRLGRFQRHLISKE